MPNLWVGIGICFSAILISFNTYASEGPVLGPMLICLAPFVTQFAAIGWVLYNRESRWRYISIFISLITLPLGVWELINELKIYQNGAAGFYGNTPPGSLPIGAVILLVFSLGA